MTNHTDGTARDDMRSEVSPEMQAQVAYLTRIIERRTAYFARLNAEENNATITPLQGA